MLSQQYSGDCAMPEHVPVNEFFEAVEQRITRASASELQSILRHLASRVPPANRRGFLRDLTEPQSAADEQGIQGVLRQGDLLSDIDERVRALKAEAQRAHSWMDEDGGFYDDEDSLGPYARFLEPLMELFDRTAGVFDRGATALAREAYRRLFFEALEVEDDYGRGARVRDLPEAEMRGARARYLRAVYEGERGARRPAMLFDQMLRLELVVRGGRVTLSEVIAARPEPLPEQEEFLRAWIALLRLQPGAAADLWLREAIRLSEGTRGLAAFALEEGARHPRAYVDWVAALRDEGTIEESMAAAREALRALPPERPIRAQIADFLSAAALSRIDPEALQEGRWEAFTAYPGVSRLLDLREAAPPGDRIARMREAARWLAEVLERRKIGWTEPWDPGVDMEAERPFGVWGAPAVLAHALLLGGEWEAARAISDLPDLTLGWSSPNNPQGVVVPALLRLLSSSPATLSANLTIVWERTGTHGAGIRSFDEDDEGTRAREIKRLTAAYQELPEQAPMDAGVARALVRWCVDMSERRAQAIVEQQHRGAYPRAAALLAACAEALNVQGQESEASALVQRLKARFPRHTAFQRELDAAMGRTVGARMLAHQRAAS
jgi:hypothetical protein